MWLDPIYLVDFSSESVFVDFLKVTQNYHEFSNKNDNNVIFYVAIRLTYIISDLWM